MRCAHRHKKMPGYASTLKSQRFTGRELQDATNPNTGCATLRGFLTVGLLTAESSLFSIRERSVGRYYPFRVKRSRNATPPPSSNAPIRNHFMIGRATKPITTKPIAIISPASSASVGMIRQGPGCRGEVRSFIPSLSLTPAQTSGNTGPIVSSVTNLFWPQAEIPCT